MKDSQLELLLVEDDPADAELTTLALRKHGLVNRVEVARDGAEALDFLFCRGGYAERSFSNPPQIVLLDLQLPRVSGHSVLRALKTDSRTKPIPVVILTSSKMDRDLAVCYALGANSYIQKPSGLHEFQEMVRRFGEYWLRINQAPPKTAFTENPSEDP